MIALSVQLTSSPNIFIDHPFTFKCPSPANHDGQKTVIAHFPTPCPDELLYSLCARYDDRAQYKNKGAVSLELFGLKDSTATIDLPCRLEYLVENLPAGHSLVLDRLIDEHTLLPFYSPFLKKNNVERLRKEMKGAGGGVIHKVAAITPSTIRPPDYLRFCPLCVETDRQEFRECYWHRLHQVPGVLACPKHKTLLEESDVRARNRARSCTYISAEQANLQGDVRHLDLTDTFQQGLMFISQSAEWLLNQPGLIPGYNTLHGYYMSELTAKDLAYQSKFIHTSRLVEAIRHVYPDSLLATIQCDFDEDKEYSWPFRLIKDLKLRKANHPLRHLLLIGLLGHTTKSFFRIQHAGDVKDDLIVPILASTYKPSQRCTVRKTALAQSTSPAIAANISRKPESSGQSKKLFGTGPWPCLNIACCLYRQPVITSCHVAKHWEKGTSDVGIFSCACGFTYRRNGRDKSPADQFRFDSVKEYGEIWKERLRKLWGDLTLSIHRIAPLLDVADGTIKYHAVSLGLEFPRKGPGSKVTQAKISRNWRKYKKTQIKRPPSARPTPRDRYRRELLRVIKKNPSATRSRLDKHLARQPYRWLYKHDREWLEAHRPPPFKRTESSRKVDWVTRDVQLAKEVRLAAKQIRSAERRPVRMMVSVIGRHLDKTALLTSKKLIAKMPLTVQAMSELVETHLAFAIRSIRWAAGCYRREGTVPSISVLAKRAGMTMTSTHKPEIRVVINEELESLRNTSDIPGIRAA